MKKNKNMNQNAAVNKAFDNINSAVGTQLNEIVNVIEQNGRKQKSESRKNNGVVAVVKSKSRSRFASVR